MPTAQPEFRWSKNWMIVFETHHSSIAVPGSPLFPVPKELKEPPTLAEMQAAVHGYIELVCDFKYRPSVKGFPFRYTVHVQVWVNEEGRLAGMPINNAGTAWVMMHWPYLDHKLVGPVVVLIGENAVLK